MGLYFSDYGNPYIGGNIKGESTVNCVLVYEIDKYLVNSNFKLESYSRIDTSGGLGIINKEIKIKPTVVSSKINTNTINRGANINLSSVNFKESIVAIKDYELTNRYEYQVCHNDNCITDAKSTFDYPGSGYNKTLLVLDYNLVLDKDSMYASLNRDYKRFFNDFLEIKYHYNGKDYVTKAELLNPENYSDKLILMVPNTINYSESIYAVLTIRNVSYQIKLK